MSAADPPRDHGTRRPREPCHQRLRQLWSACPLRRQPCIPPPTLGPKPEMEVAQIVEEEEDAEERICRYCFDGDGDDGELISPCRCTGGQKYVHLKCLRMWQRAVLLGQPTHPDFHGHDSRQRICNVCKSEFTCPPPTRTELMASITGPEIAALIDEGCLIGSAEDFSNDLEQQMEGFPESVRQRVVCRNWIRGAFLIVKVVQDRHAGIVQLRLDSDEEIRMLVDQISEDATAIHLRGRKFTIISRGPLRHLQADATADERREALRSLVAPISLRLQPEAVHDCGEDGVIAVNLTRHFDLASVSSPFRAHWTTVLSKALERTVGSDGSKLPFEITHFSGGPCEEEDVAACLVLTEGRCALIQDKQCLRRGITIANSIALGGWAALADEGRVSGGAPWLRELQQLRRSDDDNDEDEDEGDDSGAEERAAKRQKQAVLHSSDGVEQLQMPSPSPTDEGAAASADAVPRQDVRLLVMWGYAGWSRCQLMGEIARGSWGLCRAMPEDVLQLGPSELWQAAYPRLTFAPRNEMSESYAGQVPEEEDRRRQLRHMAIFHELLHGRPGHQRPPTPQPDAEPQAGEERVDSDDIDSETLEHARERVDSLDTSEYTEDLELEGDDEDDEDDEVTEGHADEDALASD